MKTTMRRACAAMLVASVALVGCGSADTQEANNPATAEPSAEASSGDAGSESGDPGSSTTTEATLVLGLEPSTLDMTASTAGATRQILQFNVMEGLIEDTGSGAPVPLLAEDWEVSDDGTEYVFHLREAAFSNGEAFTADDVVFSFQKAMDEETHVYAGAFEPVASVEAVADDEVKVVLSEPSQNWFSSIAGPAGVIFDESTWDQRAEQPVGTGPFRLAEWVRGDRITFDRNPEYRGDPPPLERVTFRYIQDANAQANAIQSGEVDVIAGLQDYNLFDTFAANPDLRVTPGATTDKVTMAMNGCREPFTDLRVRQALNHAIDKQAIKDAVVPGGHGQIIGAHAVPTDPWFVDTADTYPYDPERARALLEEAGYGDGFSVALRVPPTSEAKLGAQIVASQLAEFGIDVQIENLELSVWLSDVFQGDHDFDMSIVAHSHNRDIFRYADPTQYWCYDSEEAKGLVQQADAAPTVEEHDEILGELQGLIARDAVNVWLFSLPRFVVEHEYVRDFDPDFLSTSVDVRRMWLDK